MHLHNVLDDNTMKPNSSKLEENKPLFLKKQLNTFLLCHILSGSSTAHLVCKDHTRNSNQSQQAVLWDDLLHYQKFLPNKLIDYPLLPPLIFHMYPYF